MVKQAIDMDALTLKAGSHGSFDKGACLLEAVSYVAGEPWSDRPSCVSSVLGAFGRAWNDGMRSDEERASLKPYISRLIGTAGDKEADERRAWLATDWLVRVCAPAFLRLAKLDEHADKLASLQPIANAAYAVSVQGDIAAARAAARAAAGDAGAAAGDAWAAAWDAWAAAWDAARAAAEAAARAAARDAWAAAWDAARAAAEAAARDAARDAWAAAGDAGAAAGDAWAAAWDAARAAAEAALESTVLVLQTSGHDLFDRLIKADAPPERWPELVYPADMATAR